MSQRQEEQTLLRTASALEGTPGDIPETAVQTLSAKRRSEKIQQTWKNNFVRKDRQVSLKNFWSNSRTGKFKISVILVLLLLPLSQGGA